MATINVYADLAAYKAYKTSPGQTFSTDTADDAAIEDLLEAASRYIDAQAGRTFYPRVESRSFSVPDSNECNNARELWMDDDLLAVITITNGDATTLASTEYHLLPKNLPPHYAIRIRDTSSYIWEVDTDGSPEYAISINAYWGYHDRYAQRAWATGSTLNEASNLNATDLTFTVTSGTNFSVGRVIKIENELMNITGVSSNDITVAQRGDNGSTAATHANGTAVTIWTVMDTIRQACLEIASNAYSRRYGQNQSGATVTTPAGLVIGPADVSETARRTIDGLTRRF